MAYVVFFMLAKKKNFSDTTPKRMRSICPIVLAMICFAFFSLHKPNVCTSARASIPTQSSDNVFFDAIVIGYDGQIELL